MAECRVMGRATQGVRLVNLSKKNDVIASVCKVMSSELEAIVEQKSREEWNQNNDTFRKELSSEEREESNEDIVDFVDEEVEDDNEVQE